MSDTTDRARELADELAFIPYIKHTRLVEQIIEARGLLAALVTENEAQAEEVDQLATELCEERILVARLTTSLQECFEALKATSPYVDSDLLNPYARAPGRTEAINQARVLLAEIGETQP